MNIQKHVKSTGLHCTNEGVIPMEDLKLFMWTLLYGEMKSSKKARDGFSYGSRNAWKTRRTWTACISKMEPLKCLRDLRLLAPGPFSCGRKQTQCNTLVFVLYPFFSNPNLQPPSASWVLAPGHISLLEFPLPFLTSLCIVPGDPGCLQSDKPSYLHIMTSKKPVPVVPFSVSPTSGS